MDGKGAWRDNVFVERLWRSVKYEEVYLRAYETVGEARASIGRYLDFYNGPDRTKALTTPHRIKLTSTSRQSAWWPNPGRRSTYRRGEIVQTTGTSSHLGHSTRHRSRLIHIGFARPVSTNRTLRMNWQCLISTDRANAC